MKGRATTKSSLKRLTTTPLRLNRPRLDPALGRLDEAWRDLDPAPRVPVQPAAPPATPASPGKRHASPPMPPADYKRLKARIRQIVTANVPPGATLGVITRGDDDLLAMDGRTGWHFPRRADGVYAGHYPADGAEALAHLQTLQGAGAEYFLVPATALWWLDYYLELRQYLDTYGRLVHRDAACALYALPRAVPRTAPVAGPEARYQQLVGQIREVVESLLPVHATVIVISRVDDELIKLEPRRAWHFLQVEGGVYAGDYPPDGNAAIARLEALRARGGEYLLLPKTAFWWLDDYSELGEYLQRSCRLVTHQRHICMIYQIQADNDPRAWATPTALTSGTARLARGPMHG